VQLPGRAAALLLLAAAVTLASAGAGQPGRSDLGGAQLLAAATHHAAVVVDTGTSTKQICLAFPEDQISGEEALRRADAIEPIDPVFSDRYGSRGVAVCSLCGVGCGDPSNCFCNPSKYWAYSRAAPGDGAYTYSSKGASQTAVQDGDVEAWKWGKGEPPAFTTVGAVCRIDEPPPRPSATTTTTSPSTSSGESTTTTATPAARAGGPGAGATSTTLVNGAAHAGTTPAGRTATSGPGAVGAGSASDYADAAVPTQDTPPATVASDAARLRSRSSGRAAHGDRRGSSAVPGLAGVVILVAALLFWRRRLRRPRVRG